MAFTKKLRADRIWGILSYHSVQNILSSCLPCKNTDRNMHVIILLVGSFKLWEGNDLGCLEKVLRIFGPGKDEVTGGWRKLH
jgi:hypothetical protein